MEKYRNPQATEGESINTICICLPIMLNLQGKKSKMFLRPINNPLNDHFAKSCIKIGCKKELKISNFLHFIPKNDKRIIITNCYEFVCKRFS